MAVVAEGDRGRVYLAPTAEHEEAAGPSACRIGDRKEMYLLDEPPRGKTCVPYGLSTWADLFTPRQLVALTTFSDLVP